jgi:hypothetical protein
MWNLEAVSAHPAEEKHEWNSETALAFPARYKRLPFMKRKMNQIKRMFLRRKPIRHVPGVMDTGRCGAMPEAKFNHIPCRDRPGISMTLNMKEYPLQIHLPVFAEKRAFHFIPGVAVEWGHLLPRKDRRYDKVILFAREPRDGMYSMFLRMGGIHAFASFSDYCDDILPRSGLNRIDEWIFLHLAWLEFKEVLVLRFEDYKADPLATLRRALDHIGLDFRESEMRRAIDNSTHDKARRAEAAYYEKYNRPLLHSMNRSSKVGGYKETDGLERDIEKIRYHTSHICNRLGYPFKESPFTPDLSYYLPYIADNKCFDFLPERIWNMETEPTAAALEHVAKLYADRAIQAYSGRDVSQLNLGLV